MLVVRPIAPQDYAALYTCAVESGHGFTSLPVDETLLQRRIARAQEAFARAHVSEPGEEGYLFVMEDTKSGEIVGVSGIEAAVGLTDSFYHYRLGKVVHHSKELDIYNAQETLTLCNDYTGVSELCTLFLREPFRKNMNGRVLSRFRMLFMAEFRQRFSPLAIAEMRGVSDENGESPFWGWLQQHFFRMDFTQADYLTGIGEKAFVAQLMPQHPVYVSLLPPEAQAVIGQVHENTRPALKMLQAEGFRCRGYVDIFDAGPTVEAEVANIKSVRESKRLPVKIGPVTESARYIVCNTRVADFRAIQARIQVHDDHVVMEARHSTALRVEDGDQVRIVSLTGEQ
ncbi:MULTISPECIES: arginine N-succinyltransferase [Idiomarinaceae]|uniref:Arginine N-succinyltransferase n=1 Tax=Pseudidiomarina fusca TaxID=2965078 RepID=A0ABU3KYX4_9GAMM|nr:MULTISPECIES: arginine N-succinyltransferase [Idiomarinaceae]MDT7526703.1 arginine N-succinyltransferase [Pseudidiomarina sp. GXY010]MRJ42888.1 arginine N-succinyltransferase [Idiomarina sp. FeN1]NCU58439.1 arginine N-succinyltransferase [Idiomarina sp. FenA--70]NCU61136.1 arginine N-succinyltransferase [Idiomarina sp. FenBw--71]UUN13638.1 arginine N-succinyltransferase [Idiomarina loihiensis]